MWSSRTWYWVGALGVGAVAIATAIVLGNYPDIWPAALISPAGGASHAAAPTLTKAVSDNAPAGTAQPAPTIAAQPAAKATEVASLTTSTPTEARAAKPLANEPLLERPVFDVVRVEPNGDAVIAGHAAAKAAVELRDGGKVIAQAAADDSGQFVILPPALGPGSHHLELAARSGGAAAAISDPTTIEVAALEAGAPKSKPAVTPVAATPAPIAVPAPKAAAAAPAPVAIAALGSTAAAPGALAADGSVRVVIRTVEASEAGRLAVKGSAEASAVVRLYLNGALLADAIAGPDGQWSLTIEHGMSTGQYAIRADVIDRGDGAVLARAEVPFAYPQHPTAVAATLATSAAVTAPAPEAPPAVAVAPVEAPRPVVAAPPALAPAQEPANRVAAQIEAKPATAPAIAAAEPAVAPLPAPAPVAPAIKASASDVVVKDVRTTTVVRGNTLWEFGRQYYGNGAYYHQIYAANAAQIRDPNLIYPGQVFVVPAETRP